MHAAQLAAVRTAEAGLLLINQRLHTGGAEQFQVPDQAHAVIAAVALVQAPEPLVSKAHTLGAVADAAVSEPGAIAFEWEESYFPEGGVRDAILRAISASNFAYSRSSTLN